MKLYRYLDMHGILRTIEGKSLRVSRISEVNDPQELRFGIVGLEAIDSGDYKNQWFVSKLRDQLLTGCDREMGFVSYCRTGEEPVMWAHYADRHRGAVLEVSVEEPTKPDHLNPMDYKNERVMLDARIPSEEWDQHNNEFVIKLLGRKSKAWEYEEETRLYVEWDECEARDGMFLIPLYPKHLHKVILGWKCEASVAYLRKVLSDGGYTACEIWRATPDEKTFRMNLDPVKDFPAAGEAAKAPTE